VVVKREKFMDPQVLVQQVGSSADSSPGSWLVAWNVRNIGQDPLEIVAGRLPHSQFRAEERQLSRNLFLPPGQSARVEFEVACRGAPGAVIENAFLILSVRWSGQPWRILARMRVVLDEESGPQTITELVTTQRIGFSIGKTEI